jgi:hypothetical protein
MKILPPALAFGQFRPPDSGVTVAIRWTWLAWFGVPKLEV